MMRDDFDTGWDPYQELQVAKHNIGELIKAHNNTQNILNDLVDQHRQLIAVSKTTRQQLDLLRIEVNTIRQQNNH
jgi:hypothetical protein